MCIVHDPAIVSYKGWFAMLLRIIETSAFNTKLCSFSQCFHRESGLHIHFEIRSFQFILSSTNLPLITKSYLAFVELNFQRLD